MHGGRTNQIWRFGDGHENKVLKLYRAADTNPLFGNDPHHEVTCLTTLNNTGLAPRLLNYSNHSLGRWIIYEYVSGVVWSSNPIPVARLLARVHSHAQLSELRFGANGSEEIKHQTLGILKQCQSNIRDRLAKYMPEWCISPTDQLSLIHGDPVPSNIVLTDKTPVLIDWQCPKNGDPTEDIALFLSPAMQQLYRGAPLSHSEEQNFLIAYPNSHIVERYHSLKAWYHWRMAAYCLWKMDQGEQDYADGLGLECDSLNACTAPI
ncbi:MAG: aminoglycoside phosphotransferase [Blastopirellula sp.]|nr:MAG: aminoglycoside phosphotransferase [Blastopirellula sp.]